MGTYELLRSPLRFVPFAVNVWCVLMPSKKLAKKQIIKQTILGVDYAIYRSENGRVYGVEDRCPHRNIELTLGEVQGNNIRCPYHGMCVKAHNEESERPNNTNSTVADKYLDSAVKYLAVKEYYGLIWAFIGHPTQADKHPLPKLDGFNQMNSADITIVKPIDSHWSYAYDNGVDLFHYPLHEGVPFFFKIIELKEYYQKPENLYVHYRASMPDYCGRYRKGDLYIDAFVNQFSINMGEHLKVHGVATPITADGRKMIMWWFVSVIAPRRYLPLIKLILPLLKRQVSRGFQQDVVVLESEQRAFNKGIRGQQETNPAVIAGHQYLNKYIADKVTSSKSMFTKEVISLKFIIDKALRGELAIICDYGDYAKVIDPELEFKIPTSDKDIEIRRYQHFVLLKKESLMTANI